MTKLQQIKETIIKSNPEIVELNFGCDFIDKKSGKKARIIGESLLFGDEGDYTFSLFVFEDKAKDILLTQEGSNKIYDKEYKEIGDMDVEIIGRTITLSDVLRAIESNEPYKTLETDRILDKLIGYWKPEARWNFSDNDLNNQSKETLSFILKILT